MTSESLLPQHHCACWKIPRGNHTTTSLGGDVGHVNGTLRHRIWDVSGIGWAQLALDVHDIGTGFVQLARIAQVVGLKGNGAVHIGQAGGRPVEEQARFPNAAAFRLRI
jgi:hypothetical protein